MNKLNRNQLPEIFNPLFQFYTIVHSFSMRNKNAYHYPFDHFILEIQLSYQWNTVGLRCGMLSRMT